MKRPEGVGGGGKRPEIPQDTNKAGNVKKTRSGQRGRLQGVRNRPRPHTSLVSRTVTLDLYGLHRAQGGTDFTVTVKGKQIKAHRRILMAALGTKFDGIPKLQKFLSKQEDADGVRDFIRDLYLGCVMQNPGSKKLFQALVKQALVAKDLRPPRSPVRIMKVLSDNEDAKVFTIIVKNQGQIRVNPLVLRARSGLFRDMFNSVRNDTTNRVNDYSGLSYGALNEVIHFVQSGRLSAYFYADPGKLDEKEREARIRILQELDHLDVAEYYQLICPGNFYDELDQARKLYAPY